MTSLLSLQYVTPLTSHGEVVNSRLSNTCSEPEMYKLRNNMISIKRTTNNSNRLAYVDALVDANALVIESIWQIPPETPTPPTAVVPLRTFIQEVLKRSRTTYSTLQTALFYLFRSRPEIKIHLSRMQQTRQHYNQWEDAYVSCGRRMFLASLVVASKFVQDKTYRNSAWAKIAGLPVNEINAAERIFLNIINYRLYISQPTFEQWHQLLHLHVEAKTMNQPTNIQDFSNLPFQPIDLLHYHSHYHSSQQQQQQNQEAYHYDITTPTTPLSSPPATPHKQQQSNKIGWTIVLSPTSFLPATTTTITNTSRKRTRYQLQQPPLLSMSLPSSIDSSPMQTPTQISPVRMNGQTSVFNWTSPTTSFDQNHHRSIMNIVGSGGNMNNNKKRKYTFDTPTTAANARSSYNLSNVRQSKRFHS
ncbi:unnamed protein product [Mucor hiemalis]